MIIHSIQDIKLFMDNRARDLQISNRRMTECLIALTPGDGVRPSILDGVKLMRASHSVPRIAGSL